MNNSQNNLKKFSRKSNLLASLLCTCLLSACATPTNTTDKYALDYDPLEPMNRGIFQFNYTVDGVIIRPLTEGYEAVMPEQGQIMVSNAVDNIKEPVTFVNSILQLDGNNTFSALWRFMLNSTIGIGGLFDVASSVGLKDRPTGFGDTLAIYGSDTGPYIVIPFIGPSSVRDGIGRIGDVLADPITYTKDPVFYSVVGVKTIDSRHRNMKILNDIYNKSIDPYSTMRSIYTQHRDAEVKSAIKERKKSMESGGAQCHKDQEKK